MTDVVLVPPPAHGPGNPPPGPPPRQYDSAREWFDGWFSVVFARPKAFRWCAQWEKHEEARIIIGLLWETWEIAEANLDANERAIWFRDYAYPLVFDRLCAPGGTFDQCAWLSNPPMHRLLPPLL